MNEFEKFIMGAFVGLSNLLHEMTQSDLVRVSVAYQVNPKQHVRRMVVCYGPRPDKRAILSFGLN